MDDSELVLGHLRFILERVDSWLKFAEQKNAGLIVLDGVLVALLVQLLGSSQLSSAFPVWISVIIIAFVLSSALISLLSFYPELNIPFMSQEGKARTGDNLAHFGDIAKYSPEDYLKKVLVELNVTAGENLKGIAMYSEQIVVNSRIALRKYVLFSRATILTIIPICIILVSLILKCVL